jgi:hypothetical protein
VEGVRAGERVDLHEPGSFQAVLSATREPHTGLTLDRPGQILLWERMRSCAGRNQAEQGAHADAEISS